MRCIARHVSAVLAAELVAAATRSLSVRICDAARPRSSQPRAQDAPNVRSLAVHPGTSPTGQKSPVCGSCS